MNFRFERFTVVGSYKIWCGQFRENFVCQTTATAVNTKLK
jgi:hypothetical protein